ncbi:uncharacterized protein TRAVEDRAFT_49324 [Trametes versicolor FP-101664 SS1]|uniref:uncharacterized protein n=1 Tax=Trametes versicolor (strain FP-101664) TaxID=717944 RepID=UPI00046228D2|nr:uncharacterized protein TRAVEDRAFT_49324 [Trametes versicolor FP-101664 SS1]EIW56498.1 hypothetical protein TRAVEDRAFT_49324 [Trametes versicolor FP-101664 SS1]
MSSDSPPWFVISPDGSIDALAVPERLLRHPELLQRGITPCAPLHKIGVVYRTDDLAGGPVHVIKILDPSTEEVAIHERLLREIKRPNNYTIPSELTATGHPLLIMPMLGDVIFMREEVWCPRILLDIIFQLVEGADFLHSLHIVHMDMCPDNVLGASSRHAATYEGIVAHRLYIIDFNTSRQFALGPGIQGAITLPEAQVDPPNGLQHFDPYSWDVYCAGRTLERLVQQRFTRVPKPPHWVAQKYIQWLIGDERGCYGVCHCRPTARAALKVVLVLRWAVDAPKGYEWVFDTLSGLWPSDKEE